MRDRAARVLVSAGILCAASPFASGCGATSTPSTSSPEGTAPKSATASTADGVPGGSTSADAGAKDGKPFAGSTAEATELISNVVDQHRSQISTCVRSYRERRKVASGRVAVSFGIDQAGRLLGVTSKGKEDLELKSCIQDALQNAPFPRSHAGVITVTKSYEDLVVQ